MKKQEKILLAHSWVRELKAAKKISNKTLGECIQYSDTGIRKALNKETLQLEQIKMIAVCFGMEDDFNVKVHDLNGSFSEFSDTKNEVSQNKLQEVTDFIIENEKELLELSSFKFWLDTKKEESARNIVEDFKKEMDDRFTSIYYDLKVINSRYMQQRTKELQGGSKENGNLEIG